MPFPAAALAPVLASAVLLADGAPAAPVGNGSSIIVAGKAYDVGRQVVLWNDPEGFDGYQIRCEGGQTGGCCDEDAARYGKRKLKTPTLEGMQDVVTQFVLHFDGCVNSRSCFKSMHNRPRPAGSAGCGLSAHFMIDVDGTIYQTLDLLERAFHAEQSNNISVGVEICNRGKVNPAEMPRLPKEYWTRPHHEVVINGHTYDAYEFRPEQYESVFAVTRLLLRLFPKIRPVIPEKPGQEREPLLDTLDDPENFAGIVGHLHVQKDRQKWDPGAFDWKRLRSAMNGFYFPVQVSGFSALPRTAEDLRRARRAAFFNAEERTTGFFPMASGRLWHSGIHLRSLREAKVRAPMRGSLVAARRGHVGASSTSFVLIRHQIDLEGKNITFFSLLAHLDLPEVSPDSPIPWVRALAQPDKAPARKRYQTGKVALLDERIEAGDLVGLVGTASRGPEQGPEVHFEIFTTDRLPGDSPGDFGQQFRHLNAAADGPIVRREPLVRLIDRNRDEQIEGDELQRFFRTGDMEAREALRRVAVRHQHEWGDKTTRAELAAARELLSLPEPERRRLYDIAIAPYTFWDDELSAHARLPANQIVISYEPITFLIDLAARSARLTLDWPKGAALADARVEQRKLARVPLDDWTSPKASPIERPLVGPAVGKRLGPRKKSEIDLIELKSTDER